MSVAKPNYSERLQVLLEMNQLICMGINGVSISRMSTVLSDCVLSIVCEKCRDTDIFIIAGGANDFGTSVELGTDEDREDVSFYGGLNVLFTKVKALNPNALIFVVLPIRREKELQKTNEIGRYLMEYRVALLRRAIEIGFIVLDGNACRLLPMTRMMWIDMKCVKCSINSFEDATGIVLHTLMPIFIWN